MPENEQSQSSESSDHTPSENASLQGEPITGRDFERVRSGDLINKSEVDPSSYERKVYITTRLKD